LDEELKLKNSSKSKDVQKPKNIDHGKPGENVHSNISKENTKGQCKVNKPCDVALIEGISSSQNKTTRDINMPSERNQNLLADSVSKSESKRETMAYANNIEDNNVNKKRYNLLKEEVVISDIDYPPANNLDLKHFKSGKVSTEKISVPSKQDTLNSNLDIEAIKLSSRIFKLAESVDRDDEMDNRSSQNKPELSNSNVRRPSLKPQLPSKGSLDHEAIKICNSIFSETTQMTPEEMQSNEESIQQKISETKSKPFKDTALKAKCSKTVKPKNNDDIELPIKHAKQCILINGPILDSPLSPTLDRKKFQNKSEVKVCRIKTQEQTSLADKIKDNSEETDKQTHSKVKDNDKHVLQNTNKHFKIDKESRVEFPKNIDIMKESKTNKINDSVSLKPSPKVDRKFDGIAPSRNATISDFSKVKQKELPPLSQSNSFAFSRKSPTSPILARRNLDRNFNASPSPYFGGKFSVHFSEPSASNWNRQTPVSTTNTSSNSRIQGQVPSPSRNSSIDYRAKSEGSTKTDLGNTFSAPISSSSADLFHKIQATKEQYKKSYNKAMNFEKTSKPVMIKEKLPRPGNEYSKYNSSLERASRRLDREKTVIEQLIQDKVGRGISLDKKYYKN